MTGPTLSVGDPERRMRGGAAGRGLLHAAPAGLRPDRSGASRRDRGRRGGSGYRLDRPARNGVGCRWRRGGLAAQGGPDPAPAAPGERSRWRAPFSGWSSTAPAERPRLAGWGVPSSRCRRCSSGPKRPGGTSWPMAAPAAGAAAGRGPGGAARSGWKRARETEHGPACRCRPRPLRPSVRRDGAGCGGLAGDRAAARSRGHGAAGASAAVYGAARADLGEPAAGLRRPPDPFPAAGRQPSPRWRSTDRPRPFRERPPAVGGERGGDPPASSRPAADASWT